jgi:hypothetical protein
MPIQQPPFMHKHPCPSVQSVPSVVKNDPDAVVDRFLAAGFRMNPEGIPHHSPGLEQPRVKASIKTTNAESVPQMRDND